MTAEAARSAIIYARRSIKQKNAVSVAVESEKLSQRVKRGKASAARRGEPYPVAPYGYRAVYDPDTGKRAGWVVVTERSQIVREIILRAGRHESLKAIRRDLEQRGVLTARGAGWTEQQIRHMAMNPAYAGLLRLDDGSLIEGNWPAIVSKAEWHDAMAVLGPRKTGMRPGSQRHLLTYLGNCGQDSTPLVARTVGGTLRYSCKTGCFYIPAEWLDELVTDVICERLSRPDARDLVKRDDARSEQLRNEVAELQAQLDEWASADISARAYALREAKLLPRIQGKQRQADAFGVPPALAGILSAADVRAAWEDYSVQARRAIIAAVTGVEVCRGPAPDWVPAEATRAKIWVRFTWVSLAGRS